MTLIDQHTITTPLLGHAGDLARQLQAVADRLTRLAAADGFVRQARPEEFAAVMAAAAAARTAGGDVQLVATDLHARALAAGDCGHGYRVRDSCPMCDREAEDLLTEREMPPTPFATAAPYALPAGDVDELFEAFTNDGGDFPGQRYWTARRGLVVTSQIEGDAVQRVDCVDLDVARAEFAEQTCDDRPGGPQPGDTILVHHGDAAGETVVVERVDVAGDAQWLVTVTGRTEPLQLRYSQYQITRRTRPTPPEHLTTEPLLPFAAADRAQVVAELGDAIDTVRVGGLDPAAEAALRAQALAEVRQLQADYAGDAQPGCPDCGTAGTWRPGPGFALICDTCGHRA
ncbi:hypothetical protein ACQEVZ_60735 [Dactylosporangium sp. CA-152071]|uniref:hypothetical protein n=1 Tax=Dactylosporangium sp. CA-152071 TaxID=3239933 RepID=UPI003D92E433